MELHSGPKKEMRHVAVVGSMVTTLARYAVKSVVQDAPRIGV